MVYCSQGQPQHSEQQLQTLVSHMNMKSIEKLAVDSCHFAACELL
jgi:hypothetical protein